MSDSISLSGQVLDDATTVSADATAPDEALATILHEIKTPLTSLLGYARMLRINGHRMQPDRRSECFDVMERQGRRVIRMLEDLLESSRLSSGTPTLRRAQLDMGEIVRASVATAAGLTNEHRFVVDMPADDMALYGDRAAIEHVITNLLENAAKYSPPGTTIALTVVDQGTEVHVNVIDEGVGISEEDLPYIFERYRRAGSESAGGVGLGLSIVAGLVSAHGGRVWVDSEPGAGTTFSFSLPRRSR